MQRSGAPEGHQGQLTGVDAAGDAHLAQGLLHAGVDHRHHAAGVDPGPGQGGTRRLHVEASQPRKGGPEGDAPENQVGVGDRWLLASPPVAGRPGDGSRRAGPHDQGSPGIEAGDRATAGTHRVDLERGQAHGKPARLPLRRRLGDASLDQAHVGAGAAHVEADGVRPSARRRHRRRCPHTAGRPRQQERGGDIGRLARRDQSSRRGQHQNLRRNAVEAAQVGPAHGAQVGVHHRRGGPLVLPELGRHLVRAAHVVALVAEAPRHGPLVGGVEVGVQQAHRHRRHRRVDHGQRLDIEPLQLGAVGRQPASHLVAPVAGHERLGPIDARVIERRAVLAGDLDHVGEAPIGDQGNRRAPPLEQGVGGHRRAVGQHLRADLARRPESHPHRLARVLRSRGHLRHRAVTCHDVGERAARVGPHPHFPTVPPTVVVARRRTAARARGRRPTPRSRPAVLERPDEAAHAGVVLVPDVITASSAWRASQASRRARAPPATSCSSGPSP